MYREKKQETGRQRKGRPSSREIIGKNQRPPGGRIQIKTTEKTNQYLLSHLFTKYVMKSPMK